ncbi:MAG TPA: class I SAM-dependent methyltransferase [Puia sp.]|nr:class I SAM-dependent methyltransferase [Puia sp.]
MLLLERLRRSFLKMRREEVDPALAYDQWAAAYDNQPDNLMLALDEEIVGELLRGMDLQSALVADVGCGTGRHWPKLRLGSPSRIVGFDISAGMLGVLKQKYPEAETVLLADNRLTVLEDGVADLLISTLTIAHIENSVEALKEWLRILKPGGRLLLTDYHPDALLRGARRSFRYDGETRAIINFIHPVDEIRRIAAQLGMREIRFIEKRIDETVRVYYERQQALPIYHKFSGTPIIYGMLLIKIHVASTG